MSLISDALKASQREKDRRTSTAHPPAPLIVPLRSKSKPEFSWSNSLKIGGSLVVIAVSLWILAVRMGFTERPVRSLATSAPVIPQSAAVTTPTDTATYAAAKAPAAPAPRAPTTVAAAVPPARADSVRRVAVAPRPTPARRAVKRDTLGAVLQGRTLPETVAVATAQPPGGGRLRISVEQPRGYEASRLFAVGVAAQRAGDLDAARSAYERVLAMSPNDVDALNNLGVLLGAQHEYDRAEQVMRRVVLLAPRNAGGWNNLGTVLAQAGHPGDAVAAFQQALQVDPSNAAARVSLAQQHIAIGSPGKARELLEETIAANPSLAEAQYTLGQACELTQDWPAAIRAYNAFIRVAPARMAADVERVRRRVEMLSARVK